MINRESLLKWSGRILAIFIAIIILAILIPNLAPENLSINLDGSLVSTSPNKFALLFYGGIVAIPLTCIFIGYGKHRVTFRIGWILLLLMLGAVFTM